MAGVSFDEEPVLAARPLSAQSPALVRLVMRWGFAKDEKGAQNVLLGTIGICALIIIGVFVLGAVNKPEPETQNSPTWPRPVVR